MTKGKAALITIVEGLIFANADPITFDRLMQILSAHDADISRDDVKAAIETLQITHQDRGVELVKIASGYQYRVKTDVAPWLQVMWEEKPARYSKALLETLALIAYRQPITRAEVQEVRGVAVSGEIIRTLLERGWIRVVGHRDLPGKPAIFGTTKEFLDYFNLSKLSDLPTLDEIRDIERQGQQLEMQLFQEAEEMAAVEAKAKAAAIEALRQEALAEELAELAEADDQECDEQQDETSSEMADKQEHVEWQDEEPVDAGVEAKRKEVVEVDV